MKIEISNAISVHGALNEEALWIKCSCLVKNGLAKNIYQSFVKEYREWFSTEYLFSFDQIISLEDLWLAYYLNADIFRI